MGIVISDFKLLASKELRQRKDPSKTFFQNDIYTDGQLLKIFSDSPVFDDVELLEVKVGMGNNGSFWVV